MITQLEQDILECDIKWTLGRITMNKASEGDGLPAELFAILKDDAECYTQYASKFGKQHFPQDWKISAFIPVPMKGNAK